MSLTPEQYLALSTMAYSRTLDGLNIGKNGINIDGLIENGLVEGYYRDDDSVALEFRALSSLSNWVIVNAHTSPSGMSAIAVQNPETKEVVFVYRGTDPIEKDFVAGIKDWSMDLRIAVGDNLKINYGRNQLKAVLQGS